jgi:hypothetical protein
MAIIQWPSNLAPGPGSGFGQRRYDINFSSGSTGADQDRVLGPPRWQLSIVQPEVMQPVQAGQWKALLMLLRGRVNHLEAWDFGCPRPKGTLSGTITLGAAALAGATALTLAGCGGAAVNLLQAGTELDDQAVWMGAATVVPDTTLGPFGDVLADTVTDASTTQIHVLSQTVTLPNDSASYRFSAYVHKKYAPGDPTFTLSYVWNGGTVPKSGFVRLNTYTGAILSGAGTVTSEGSYWRVVLDASNNGSGHTAFTGLVTPAGAAYGETASDVTVTGSAVVTHVQLEAGTTASRPSAATLLQGDLLQVGTGLGTQQVVMVTADAVGDAAGAMAVNVEPPLRVGHSLGAAVRYDKPSAFFKLQSSGSQWAYQPGQEMLTTGISLDLLEAWT